MEKAVRLRYRRITNKSMIEIDEEIELRATLNEEQTFYVATDSTADGVEFQANDSVDGTEEDAEAEEEVEFNRLSNIF